MTDQYPHEERINTIQREWFPGLRQFTNMQRRFSNSLLESRDSKVISAPANTGKTTIVKVAVIDLFETHYHQRSDFVCIFICPFVALCDEVSTKWNQFFFARVPQIVTTNLCSEQENMSIGQKFKRSNIVVATPEKIYYALRNNLITKVDLLIIDEVHSIQSEDRGWVFDAAITILMRKFRMQVIAMSATIANTRDLAAWLGVDPFTHVLNHIEGEDPQPRIQEIREYDNHPQVHKVFGALRENLAQFITRVNPDHQTLIFCDQVKESSAACTGLIELLQERVIVPADRVDFLNQLSNEFNNNDLRNSVRQGVAFHNASLDDSDKFLVIRSFLNHDIKWLCSTGTLHAGVNLPAKLVVLLGTSRKTYPNGKIEYTPYSSLEVQQMKGRAGRRQFHQDGIVLLLGRLQPQLLQPFIVNNIMTESQFEECLLTAMHYFQMTSREQAMSFAKSTFHYISLQNQPNHNNPDNSIGVSCRQAFDEFVRVGVIQSGERISFTALSSKIFQQSTPFANLKMLHSSFMDNTEPTHSSFHQFLWTTAKVSTVSKSNMSSYCKTEFTRYNKGQTQDEIRYRDGVRVKDNTQRTFMLIQMHLSGYVIRQYFTENLAKSKYLFRRAINTVKFFSKKNSLFWETFFSFCVEKFMKVEAWDYPRVRIIRQIPPLNGYFQQLDEGQITNLEDLKIYLAEREAEDYNNDEGFPVNILRATQNYIRNFDQITLSVTGHTLLIEHNFTFSQMIPGFKVVIGDDNNTLCRDEHYFHQSRMNNFLEYTANQDQFPLLVGLEFDGCVGFDRVYRVSQDGNKTPFPMFPMDAIERERRIALQKQVEENKRQKKEKRNQEKEQIKKKEKEKKSKNKAKHGSTPTPELNIVGSKFPEKTQSPSQNPNKNTSLDNTNGLPIVKKKRGRPLKPRGVEDKTASTKKYHDISSFCSAPKPNPEHNSRQVPESEKISPIILDHGSLTSEGLTTDELRRKNAKEEQLKRDQIAEANLTTTSPRKMVKGDEEEPKQELSWKFKQKYKQRVRQKMQKELKQKLEKELRSELRSELRQELKKELKQELMKELLEELDENSN